MTKEELMQVYYLNKEIAAWREELERIRSTPEISAMGACIKTRGYGRYADKVADTAVSIAETEQKIRKKLVELEEARSKVTNYILAIDDCQTRLIFKLRCLDLLNWNAVADKVGGMNSEYSVKKRFYRYLEKCG